MGIAHSSAARPRAAAAARRAWLARFGPEPPLFARDLLDRVTTVDSRRSTAGITQAAQSLGVLRAHHGHSIAGLVEDLTALRALVDDEVTATTVIDAALAAASASYVDELSAILEARATRDPLTGLPNRAAFGETLAHELRSADRAGTPALLLIDLDGFKGVNDSDGHLAGDAVLVGVAELLRAQVRGGDLPCRLGGDEFAVLLPRTSLAQATKVARRVLHASRLDDRLASPSARVHLSVGVGSMPPATPADALVGATDAALYAAKAAGGDCIRTTTAP